MSQTRWGQARAEERFKAIVRTATEMFARKGFETATMEEIANELKLTKGSIYYYINSKEELLYLAHKAAMTAALSHLEEVLSSDAPSDEKFLAAIRNQLTIPIEEAVIQRLLLQQEQHLSQEWWLEIVALRDHYESTVLSLLRQAVADGKFQCENPEIVLKAVFGAINWMPHWYRPSGPLSRERIADLICDYLMRGFLVSPIDECSETVVGGAPSLDKSSTVPTRSR